jgi:hypothetical protein
MMLFSEFAGERSMILKGIEQHFYTLIQFELLCEYNGKILAKIKIPMTKTTKAKHKIKVNSEIKIDIVQ